MKRSIMNEYLCYLIDGLGLLNEYQLYEIGITFDEYSFPNDEVIKKIEDYISKKIEIN